MAKKVKTQKDLNVQHRSTFRRKKTCHPACKKYVEMIKVRYGEDIYNDARVGIMYCRLLRDVFAHTQRRDLTKDRVLRKEYMEDLARMVGEFGEKGLLYVPEGSPIDGLDPLFKGSRLCFTDSKYGMPFFRFLLCLISDDFVDDKIRYTSLEYWTGIPAGEMDDVYLSVITAFFREENNAYYANNSESDLYFLDRKSETASVTFINIKHARFY